MDGGVIVALIAAASGIALGIWNTFWAHREKARERKVEANVALARYRTPLLDAAADLGARIHNIQCEEFGLYAGENERRELAMKSNLYRFARYFAVAEILRSQVGFLEFDRAKATKSVAARLSEIEGLMTTDQLDGERLMLWREEQRAIGELCIERSDDGQPLSIGFATFVDQFETRLEWWLRRFRSDLETANVAATSPRLEQVQFALQGLVDELDEEDRYRESSPGLAWLRRRPGD